MKQRMTRILSVFALATVVAFINGCGGSGEIDLVGGMWIAPNHPAYQWDAVPPAKVPWDKITHLALGYVLLKEGSNGYTVTQDGVNGGYAQFKVETKEFTDAARTHSRLTFMMIGGENSNPDDIWNKATAPANIKKFAANIVTEMKSMGLDGIEIDWEENIDWDKIGKLATEVRAIWPDGIITIDTFPFGDEAEALAGYADAVDMFMPMTFLNVAQWGGWILPAPTSPIYEPDNNGYCYDRLLKKWTDAGVSPKKLLFGVGGYGGAWGDDNGDGKGPIAPYANRANPNTRPAGETAAIFGDNYVTQAWVDKVVADHNLIEGWDDIGKSSYWHVPSETDFFVAERWGTKKNVTLVFYETDRSMKEKLDYVKAKGMSGFNFWTLSQLENAAGAYPLLNAIAPK